MLKIYNVKKAFGDNEVLKGVSFEVSSGEIFGLIGKNGAGKTTLMNIVAGLSKADSGSVCRAETNMKIGYLPDSPNFFEFLTCGEYLDYLLKDKDSKKRIQLLDLVELSGKTAISTMSRGMRQRLGIAAAIVGDPELILLDEPTSGVDPITRKEFWMHINAMVSHGISVIVTTHFMDEAENCDEIALVYRGKIRAMGSPDDLKALCDKDSNPTLEKAFIKIVEKADKHEKFTQTFKE